MIVNLFLPLFASFAADSANRFIPCDWFGGRVAMLANLGILTRWNDRSNLLCGQRLVHFPLIVGAVATKGVIFSVRLHQQAFDGRIAVDERAA